MGYSITLYSASPITTSPATTPPPDPTPPPTPPPTSPPTGGSDVFMQWNEIGNSPRLITLAPSNVPVNVHFTAPNAPGKRYVIQAGGYPQESSYRQTLDGRMQQGTSPPFRVVFGPSEFLNVGGQHILEWQGLQPGAAYILTVVNLGNTGNIHVDIMTANV